MEQLSERDRYLAGNLPRELSIIPLTQHVIETSVSLGEGDERPCTQEETSGADQRLVQAPGGLYSFTKAQVAPTQLVQPLFVQGLVIQLPFDAPYHHL
jgi:hypothetical protein